MPSTTHPHVPPATAELIAAFRIRDPAAIVCSVCAKLVSTCQGPAKRWRCAECRIDPAVAGRPETTPPYPPATPSKSHSGGVIRARTVMHVVGSEPDHQREQLAAGPAASGGMAWVRATGRCVGCWRHVAARPLTVGFHQIHSVCGRPDQLPRVLPPVRARGRAERAGPRAPVGRRLRPHGRRGLRQGRRRQFRAIDVVQFVDAAKVDRHWRLPTTSLPNPTWNAPTACS